jgi:hypothetical protein
MDVCSSASGAWGDFNLIRSAKDKNNSNINQMLMDKINLCIDLHQLKEIRSGSKYIWTNKQLNLVMVNLDRILMSTEWETSHPLCYAWSNGRVGSDHWPIFLDSGEKFVGQTKHFYFQKQWLLEEGFSSLCAEQWGTNRTRFDN